ncbi:MULTISPECIES: hypothetical protein [unclassified Streptomyces]|uniref:hypothetical protein n=1 Tax=unclassified Streptomyces TaxID=2593676 RepID=UPI000DC7D776|nr:MULTISPECIES: hypothetical protein [unclassified Streptomyces]AWZ08264.1 hypothetical protein DRB89_30865 [Streptomyces sp. ICC4]AWZ16077.1 hypothetical protein DRB96_31810 [Streptomyces sp. ICC1]
MIMTVKKPMPPMAGLWISGVVGVAWCGVLVFWLLMVPEPLEMPGGLVPAIMVAGAVAQLGMAAMYAVRLRRLAGSR